MTIFSDHLDNPTDIKVLQISDMHLFDAIDKQLVGVNTEQSFLSVLQLAQDQCWPPDVIFLTGDLSQDGTDTSYQRLNTHLSALNIPCFLLPGNHDTPDKLAALFNHPSVSYQPFLHHGSWLFAFLNSETPGEEGGSLDDAEVTALEREIKLHPTKNVLICLHHQLQAINSPWLDTMAVRNPDKLITLIRDCPKIHAVIHGHIHQAFESRVAGKPVYGVPSTCFQFKPLSKDFAIDTIPPGFRWLRLSSNGGIKTDIIRLQESPINLDKDSAGY